jgi:ABC-type spermidine/putrescine transport system permease subunit II
VIPSFFFIYFFLNRYNKMANDDTTDLGTAGTVAAFIAMLIFLIIAVVIWVWAVYAIISNRKRLGDFPLIASIVCLFIPGIGPVGSLLIVYLSRK